MITVIANAIIEHSIIPYAKASGIDVTDLIHEIATIDYLDTDKALVKTKMKIKTKTKTKDNDKYKLHIEHQKRGRGRPKGSKNKYTSNIQCSMADD